MGVMMEIELIKEVLQYIEDVEQKIEGEFGSCRIFEQIVADGDAPEVYGKLKALLEGG